MKPIKQPTPEVFDDYWLHVWRMMTMAEERTGEYEANFTDYFRITAVEARPYVVDEDMTDIVVGEGITPKEGDMIARNPRNRDVLWLMPKEVFETNFESQAAARGVKAPAAKPAPRAPRKEF